MIYSINGQMGLPDWVTLYQGYPEKNSPYLQVTFAASLFGGRWNRYFGYPSIMT
jgi:hypothetical protein